LIWNPGGNPSVFLSYDCGTRAAGWLGPDPIYRGPWIARKDVPDEQLYKIQKALLNISMYDDVEKILKDLGTKGYCYRP